MKLYHGTTAAVARACLTGGLKPRGATRVSNWKHTVESNPWLVYLTDAYAAYFAMQAFPIESESSLVGIIEIETDKLPKRWFRPDEDFIAQVTMASAGGKNLHEHTQWVRDNVDKFANLWQMSVQTLGNCAYKGTIPVSAITRVTEVDIKKCKQISAVALDPTISVQNYAFYGKYYNLICQWFAGYEVNVDAFLNFGWRQTIHHHDESTREKLREHWVAGLGVQKEAVKILR